MIGDRWGVTDAEVSRPYPCDEFVPAPTLQAWRGVTIETQPDRVWSWLVQVRLAPYSYDWIDNAGRRSPREFRNLPDPVPGDPFSASAGRPIGRVLAVEPGISLTARIMGGTLTYEVVPEGERRTRLLLKIVGSFRWPVSLALCVGDLVMARRQLLNFKQLAESG